MLACGHESLDKSNKTGIFLTQLVPVPLGAMIIAIADDHMQRGDLNQCDLIESDLNESDSFESVISSRCGSVLLVQGAKLHLGDTSTSPHALTNVHL